MAMETVAHRAVKGAPQLAHRPRAANDFSGTLRN
jgi:hypothetical protein